MPYRIDSRMNCRGAQAIFETYCADLKAGRTIKAYKTINGDKDKMEVPIDITPDTFTMAYAPDSNALFSKCRSKLPKYWFVSKEGIIISFERNTPIWIKGNKIGRNESEFQAKFGNHTMYNYVLVAIIYESDVICTEEDKANIRKYGINVFGVGNSGNSKAGAKGARGYKEISPENMMDVHHVSGANNLSPDYLQIMPHWLHDKLKIITASVTNEREFWTMLNNPDYKECADYLNRVYPDGYIIHDMSKEVIDSAGNTDVYVNYKDINESRKNQVDSRYYKYFMVKPFNKTRIVKLKLNIATLNATDLEHTPFTFKFVDSDGETKEFTIAFKSGNLENYKMILQKMMDSDPDSDYMRDLGNAIYKKMDIYKHILEMQPKNDFILDVYGYNVFKMFE